MRTRTSHGFGAVMLAGLGLGLGLVACGLSLAGTASLTASDGGAGGADGAPLPGDATPSADVGSSEGGGGDDGGSALDAADAADARGCVPLPADAGILGPVDLSKLTMVGTANWNENSDGMLTLTNSNLFDKGAAWTPMRASPMWEYHLKFQVRVGPNNTGGDGIAFAVLQGPSVPGVGNDGDGIGLRGLAYDGYAVIVDMYKTATDGTDLATTTLKLVTMRGFITIANVGMNEALNDGNLHLVEVSLTGGNTLSATVHGPTLQATVTKTDPAFATTTASFVGFTAATGGGSNSHNEVATLTVLDACR